MSSAKIRSDIMKEVRAILAEQNEGIRNGFAEVGNNIKGVHQELSFKLAIAYKALEKVGISPDMLQSIAAEFQQGLQQQQSGGNQNDPYGSDTPGSGQSGDADSGEGAVGSDEGGEEHYGDG